MIRPSQDTPPYTVAIIADIHGNLTALEAVLADLATRHYDQLVIAGDLVMNGPFPAETLARMRDLRVPTISGETDRAVVEADNANPLAQWTAEQIGPTGIEYLKTLPFSHSITPSQSTATDTELLIVHATPTNAGAFLILQPNPLDARCSALTPEVEALAMLGEVTAPMIVHGHLHYASSGVVGACRVVSIGSVGFPFDGSPQAAYALATWEDTHWNIAHRRVPYDVERAIVAVECSGQPLAETIIQRLRAARWSTPK